ncbi:MAG: hypothetical protein MJE68_26245 [Proteobacteria bacterium]|nr:hypothetical protein [Pseudomonadota bacterium]
MPLLFVLFVLYAVSTEPGEEFMRNSNGIAEYEFVNVDACPGGERRSGYSIAPFDKVVLKQVNPDRTISEPVCSN